MSLEIVLGGKPSTIVGDKQLGYVHFDETLPLAGLNRILLKYFNILPKDIKQRMETKKRVNEEFKQINHVYVNINLNGDVADINYYCYARDPKKFSHKQNFEFFDENSGEGIDLLGL